MCGSETLAMLVSSTSMNVASITVAAISQGLTLGVQGMGGFAAGASTGSHASRLAPSLSGRIRRRGESANQEEPTESL